MSAVSRGVRNAFRNNIRTFSIVIILGLSIGLSITMLAARQAVQTKIELVKSSIGNTITVSPAGMRGFEGGGEALTAAQLSSLKSLAHVVSITSTLQDRLSSDSTTLQSAIEAGSMGRRFRDAESKGDNSLSKGAARSFTPPVSIIGADNAVAAVTATGGSVKVTSGALYAASSVDDVAVLGKAIAAKNNLSVDSTFKAYDADIKVVAIYDAGNTFSNNGVIMPLATVQKLSGQTDAVTTAVVKIDSIVNVDSTAATISSKLGSAADVTSSKDTADAVLEPLENIKTVSTFSLIGSVIAGAIIVLLTMVMIVRERRREIGVLKALGATDLKVALQFIVESATLTMLGAIGGLIGAIIAAGPITKLLVTANSTTATTGGPGTPGMGRGGGAIMRIIGGGVNNVQAVIGWETIIFGLAAALVIAVLGSALPAWLIAKVKPAEVMRAE